VGAYLQVYEAFDVSVDGPYAYLAAGEDGLKILSLSNPEQPTLVTSEPIGDGIARSVALLAGVGDGDTYACIAAQHGGLRIMQVTDPNAPVEISTYSTPGPDARDLAIAGGIVYVADGAGGVDAVDMSEPSHPNRMASYTLMGDAHDIAISGSQLFVAGGALGLHALSYEAGQMALLDTADTPGNALRVEVSGMHAFVADFGAGLCVISLVDPFHMSLRQCISGPGPALAVAVQGQYAFVAVADAGLWIVSVQDPNSPVAVRTVSLPGEALDVAVSGGQAYVAAGERGLRVVSVADPTAAHEVGQGMETPGNAASVAVVDGRAYVGDSELGVIMVDVSDPAQPEAVGTGSTGGVPLDLAASDDQVYVAAEAAGLRVLSFINPTDPQVAASVQIAGTSNAVRLDPVSNLAFVAARDGGVVVVSTRREYRVYLPLVLKAR
jgi:hypothetical protein